MRVLYDYQAFEMQTYGGVSRCFAELASNLPQETEGVIGLLRTNNTYLINKGYGKLGKNYNEMISSYPFANHGLIYDTYCKISKKIIGFKYKRNHHYCQKLLSRGSFDVFHPTFYGDWFLNQIGNTPFVITIHDMIPERYPQYFSKNNMQITKKSKLAHLASKIIAVSENTKNDIIEILQIPENKIEVIYHGVNDNSYENNMESPYARPYILYVGNRHAYKNFDLFIQSIAEFLTSNKNLLLVCTGNPFNQYEKRMFSELGISSQITHQYVDSDVELTNLFHHALCFVFPSEYEGFGIPILEAYKAECPVLLNKRSCFPEIAGDAAIYFDMDHTTNNFALVFESFLSDYDNIRKDLLSRQEKRLKRYSWKQSAALLSNVYHSI